MNRTLAVAALGALVGLVVGYVTYALGAGVDGARALPSWLENNAFDLGDWLPWPSPGLIWMGLGVAIALLADYVCRDQK